MDIVSDGLTVIRNGQKSGLDRVTLRGSKLLEQIAAILKDRGYIKDFSVMKDKKFFIDVKLKYDDSEKPVIRKINRISKNSCRLYSKADKIPRIMNGYATVIITTSRGVMTGREAREKKIGGEPVCYVF